MSQPEEEGSDTEPGTSKKARLGQSDVYLHGHKSPGKSHWICNKCSKSFYGKKGSTSAFTRHISDVHGIGGVGAAGQKDLFSYGITKVASKDPGQMKSQFYEDACKIIFKARLPFSFFRKPGVPEFFQKWTGFSGPVATTVASYLVRCDALCEDEIRRELRNVDSVAITIDLWTSKRQYSYLGITVHFVDSELNLVKKILTFKHFPNRHTPVQIAEMIKSELQKFEILEKICCATTDSGTNIVRALKILGIKRVPCIAHNLHLVLMAGAGLWTQPPQMQPKLAHSKDEASDKEEDIVLDLASSIALPARMDVETEIEDLSEEGFTGFEASEVAEAESVLKEFMESHDGDEEWVDASLLNDYECESFKTPVKVSRSHLFPALQKIRGFIRFLHHSPTESSIFRSLALQAKKSEHLPMDVRVRWGSTSDMISAVIAHRQVITKYFDMDRDMKSAEKLSKYGLDLTEWVALIKLQEILSRFKEATNLLSGSEYPTLNIALLVLDGLKSFCQAEDPDDDELSKDLKASIFEKLMQYFDCNPSVDEALLQTAAYLHPMAFQQMSEDDRASILGFIRLDLELFIERQQVSTEEIQSVPPSEPSTSSGSSIEAPRATKRAKFLASVGKTLKPIRRPMTTPYRVAETELEHYEKVAHQAVTEDALDFWKSMGATKHLQRYAVNRLAIPATSVPCEQAFSVAGYLTRKELARSKSATTEKMMFVGDKL